MLSCLRACRIHPCGFFWLLQICLSEQSVGFLLQTTIGSVAIDFRPQQLSERVFKFKMNSRNVGFHVYNLRSFTRDQYKVFFHLWGNEGPHWTSEAKKYYQEEDNQWETISHNRNQNRSYVSVLKGPARLSGANRVPIGHSKSHHHRNSVFSHRSAFDRLQWPEHHHHSSQDHQKDLSRALVMNMGQKRDQRPSQISNSKLLEKGK
jgi:hypothetical protein